VAFLAALPEPRGLGHDGGLRAALARAEDRLVANLWAAPAEPSHEVVLWQLFEVRLHDGPFESLP